MKHIYGFFIGILCFINCYGQTATSFQVQGDFDKFYPVVFFDANFNLNQATEVQIGRSNVHADQTWRGSLIAKFRVHTTNWGNGSQFIDADVRQYDPISFVPFVAGWADASTDNNTGLFIIWLRGGSTTYYAYSAANVNLTIYDGVAHPLPYQQTNGPARTYKTSVDAYVNSYGESKGGTAFFTGPNNNYFNGNVGIGTYTPDAKLAVQGTIHATEIKVDQSVPTPDYVFDKDYDLASLKDVKTYIDKNHHLSEIPSAEQVAKDGINLGEMNAKLLKKIEELTLYLIEQKEETDIQIKALKLQIKKLSNQRK